MSIGEVTNELNKKSGFQGVCGVSDCRDVESLMEKDDHRAILAYDMYTDRVAKYIADYYLELEGKVDAIVFTAGVGENGPMFREKVVNKLAPLGIKLDREDNNNTAGYKDRKEGTISSKDSTIKVYVEPTNEVVMIVKDTYELVQK